MYTCGPTVYDYFHIGNARTFLVSDVVRRYLEFQGYHVKLVQNITDIDDKIINRANESGIDAKQLSQKYAAAYFEDSQRLGIRPADVHPRATDHVPEILELLQTLIDKGAAYERGGDLYYRINRFPNYGKLSNRDVNDVRAGARVAVNEQKEDPRDFDLWKMAKPGEPSWESPWGRGRPGWHIECSAMAMKHLGETLDIHAGGQDLQFPHHENEIAQSELATGKPFARYWLHVAFLRTGGRRMGKSEQNFILVRDALRDYAPEAIRHFLISAQYRHPLDFNDTSLKESSSAIRRLDNCLGELRQYQDYHGDKSLDGAERSQDETALIESVDTMCHEFKVAMDDDFNTAGAIGAIFKFVGDVNPFLAAKEPRPSHLMNTVLGNAYRKLAELCGVLGINVQKSAARGDHPGLVDDLMDLILEVRQEARMRKDWEVSDNIRDRLQQLNIELKDSRLGTTWQQNDA